MTDITEAKMGPTLDDLLATLRPFVRTNADGSFVAPKDEALSDLLTLAESMQQTIDLLSRRAEQPTLDMALALQKQWRDETPDSEDWPAPSLSFARRLLAAALNARSK